MTKIDFLKICGGTLAINIVLILSLIAINQLMTEPSIQQKQQIKELIRSIQTRDVKLTPEQVIIVIENNRAVEESLYRQTKAQRKLIHGIVQLTLMIGIVQIALCISVFQKLRCKI